MKIIIGSDKDGLELKEYVKDCLEKSGYEIVDKTPKGADDFVDSAKSVAQAVVEQEGANGILVDEYGVGSFMVANKIKGAICAVVSEEHSAKMTKDHNNATILALGSGIVGKKLAKEIVDNFVGSEYSGGRHQVRVDMLNKML
ncbi:galactose-6-phosphate isomerase subunit LacA [Halonatronum saccharophilum]|uniref:galactose-6-phosphate isomerase subunit LacA n=1 Tax=Halonatronum saccharophilum TaxID=150060 RepID=UPI000482E64B|nr:galactose-6-phosphate isomerase subunit LacA [Halonatronum saccharophilum]